MEKRPVLDELPMCDRYDALSVHLANLARALESAEDKAGDYQNVSHSVAKIIMLKVHLQKAALLALELHNSPKTSRRKSILR
jgi:hypothetical protein